MILPGETDAPSAHTKIVAISRLSQHEAVRVHEVFPPARKSNSLASVALSRLWLLPFHLLYRRAKARLLTTQLRNVFLHLSRTMQGLNPSLRFATARLKTALQRSR